MPRPVDSESTREKAKQYNLQLIKLCHPHVGPSFATSVIKPTVNVFYANLAKGVTDSGGHVIRSMFTKDDGLHLSHSGNIAVKYLLWAILNNAKCGSDKPYEGKLTTKALHDFQVEYGISTE